ncbi:MAG: AAA family ATPase, partial [bacterium]|nr:AAA family ATPase [bacterium]
MTQSEALTILKTGANVFLTGEPGSGKTHTVNEYVAYLNSCGVEPAITASTGIASTHIGGMTIHSWCGIGVRSVLTPYDLDTIASNRKVMGRVGSSRVLIIDEISMLSAQTLAMVDAVCREVRRSSEPFGGLQVVFVGDFFQLPPVSSPLGHSHGSHPSPSRLRQGFGGQVGSSPRAGEQGNPEFDNLPSLDFESGVLTSPPFQGGDKRGGDASIFAFSSSSWRKANPLVCYLSEQHRQEDPAFLEFLTAVRRGEVAERHKALLRTRYKKSADAGTSTQLYSHNANVDHINTGELAKLPGQPKVFVMTGSGPDPLVLSLKRGCLSPEVLSLKLGSRVMFTKNDPAGRFMNGTTGVVTEFLKETGTPVVKTSSGRSIPAEPMEWTIQDGGKVLARVEQIPLRLAWAITVHKSQGMSLDRAHMDLGS